MTNWYCCGSLSNFIECESGNRSNQTIYVSKVKWSILSINWKQVLVTVALSFILQVPHFLADFHEPRMNSTDFATVACLSISSTLTGSGSFCNGSTGSNQSSMVFSSQITSANNTDLLDSLRQVCEVWISMPMAIAGIIGNLLSLIVLCRYKQSLTTTVVLQAIAIADSLILASNLILRSFRYIGISSYVPFHRETFVWLFPAAYVFRMVNVWLTVLLTVDRYIAVRHPLHAQHLCTLKRTHIIIACIVAAVMVLSVPRFFEYETVDLSVQSTGFRPTKLMESRAYNIVYRIAIFFVFMYLVPMTLLTALNARILYTLRKSNVQRVSTLRFHQRGSTSTVGTRSSSSNSGRCGTGGGGRDAGAASKKNSSSSNNAASNATRTVTIIAVTVVLICIVCNVSAMTSHVIYAIENSFDPSLSFYRRVSSNISNVFVTFNSAVNFVVYCAFSRKFRQMLVRLFRLRRSVVRSVCCCCCGRIRHDLDLETLDSVRSKSSARSLSNATRFSITSFKAAHKRDVNSFGGNSGSHYTYTTNIWHSIFDVLAAFDLWEFIYWSFFADHDLNIFWHFLMNSTKVTLVFLSEIMTRHVLLKVIITLKLHPASPNVPIPSPPSRYVSRTMKS